MYWLPWICQTWMSWLINHKPDFPLLHYRQNFCSGSMVILETTSIQSRICVWMLLFKRGGTENRNSSESSSKDPDTSSRLAETWRLFMFSAFKRLYYCWKIHSSFYCISSFIIFSQLHCNILLGAENTSDAWQLSTGSWLFSDMLWALDCYKNTMQQEKISSCQLIWRTSQLSPVLTVEKQVEHILHGFKKNMPLTFKYFRYWRWSQKRLPLIAAHMLSSEADLHMFQTALNFQ